MTPQAGRDSERYWAVALGERERVAPGLGEPDLTHRPPGKRAVSIWLGDRERVRTAEDERHAVLVEGRPHGLGSTDPAAALLQAYVAEKNAVTQRLGGRFSAVLRDAEDDTLLCIRDPTGIYPLFFARRGNGLAVSPSPELLAYSAATAAKPDRIALAEWVIAGATPLERTLYAGIERLPPGHALLATGSTLKTFRYWSPPITKPTAPIDLEGSLRRFQTAFEDTIARLADHGRGAVLLSGGIDSGLCAAVLAKQHRARGLAPPLAVTVKFPNAEGDEEQRARNVARTLGLPHLVIPLAEAAGGDGFFSSGVEASKSMWYPHTNPWSSAYDRLSLQLAREGYRWVISGEGGNDLLEAPWDLAGDLMRAGDMPGFVQFMDAQTGYYKGTRREYLPYLVWNHGIAAQLKPPLRRALLRAVPEMVRRRRMRLESRGMPAWALPDQQLRAEVTASRAAVTKPHSASGRHGDARTRLLDDSFIPIILEKAYRWSRQAGIEHLSPYWDDQLTKLVLALPPRALHHGGRAKYLAYASFASLAGQQLADSLQTGWFEGAFRSGYAEEGPALLAALGGLPRLADLGIVSEPHFLAAIGGGEIGSGMGLNQCWLALATEAWLQARGF